MADQSSRRSGIFVEGTFSRGGTNPNPRTPRPNIVIAPLDPNAPLPPPVNESVRGAGRTVADVRTG